jgi:hypothetical protein
MNKMDIGLFDATWAKKKETQIEDQIPSQAVNE